MSDRGEGADEPRTITLAPAERQARLTPAVGANARPCLIVYNGEDTGRPFTLEVGHAVVGRGADVQIHIDHATLSRRHAELVVGEEGVMLRDLGSVNGSQVNDQPVQAAVRLREGDLLRLGDLVLKFHERHSLEAALHDRIYRLATVDGGTEVFNRRYLLDTLRRELRLARATGRPLAMLIIDLDHFKSVNDTHGHAAGDAVLREGAALLRLVLRGQGVLGRLGGEEFGVVLPHTDGEAAADVAERLRAAVAAHEFKLPGGVPHRQTVSAGVAVLTAAMTDPAQLLDAADQRLYEAKRAGRNRVGR